MTTELKTVNNGKLEAKYPRVYKDIRSQIERGVLTGALPGVKQLALKYGVNFMTVNKAVKKLEADGLVYRISRKGTYVKRQYSVAVCFNDPNPEIMAAPVYNRVVMAAQRYFSEQNCPMYLEGSLLHRKNVVNILRKRIDGFLLFYNNCFALPEDLLHMPCVRVMGIPGMVPDVDHIGYENSKIGKLAAEYLLGMGCRSAAYIGPFGIGVFCERSGAFAACLKDAGARYYEFPYDWNHDFESIQKQMNELLRHKPLPEAIFCPADAMMVNVCTVLYRNGIQPGKDIKLIACNNSGQIIRSSPDIFASIDVRSEDIGRLAAEQLLKRIVNPELPRKVQLLEPRLVLPDEIRNSTDNIVEEV
jgi:DNA-binding LacI/PurR family transcriptional regulator